MNKCFAGSITDTYGAGDTLTASMMDNIKSAVNGNDTNKQNRVTGSCGSGESIRTTNANGTVTCEVDSDATYSAGTGLDLTGSEFSLESPVAFRASMSSSQSIGSGGGGVPIAFDTASYDSGNNFDTSTNAFVAPVSGFYHFTCTILPTNGLTGNARLSVAGNMVQVYPTWPAYQTITVTSDNYYNAGHSIDCEYFDNSAGGNVISYTYSQFSGFLVR